MSNNNSTTNFVLIPNRREIAATLTDCQKHNEIDAAALALADLWASLNAEDRAAVVDLVKALADKQTELETAHLAKIAPNLAKLAADFAAEGQPAGAVAVVTAIAAEAARWANQ